MLRHRDEGSEAAEIREMGELRGEPSRQCRALLLLVGPRVLRKTSPSPRSYGERVGVRGSLCKEGGSWIRGESPSPGIQAALEFRPLPASEIGRASCRERV